MASYYHERICFAFVFARLVAKNPKTPNLGPMADESMPLHREVYKVWDLLCISVDSPKDFEKHIIKFQVFYIVENINSGLPVEVIVKLIIAGECWYTPKGWS